MTGTIRRGVCCRCGKGFETRHRTKQTCSKECSKELRRERTRKSREDDPAWWREAAKRYRRNNPRYSANRRDSPNFKESKLAGKRRARIARAAAKTKLAAKRISSPAFAEETALRQERKERAKKPALPRVYRSDADKIRAAYWRRPQHFRDTKRLTKLRRKARAMTTKYHNSTTAELFAMLAATVDQTSVAIRSASEILLELRKRGESHPLMREGVLVWFEHIASDQLTPKAALAFAGVNSVLRKLVGIDPALQDRIADGEEIPVAELDGAGKIVRSQKPVLRMDQAQLDRAFDASKLRPLPAQEKMLRSEQARGAATPKTAKKERVAADEEFGVLRVANMKIAPEELREPLRALGFRLVRIGAAKEAA